MSTFYTLYPYSNAQPTIDNIGGPPGPNSSFSFMGTAICPVVNGKFNNSQVYEGFDGRTYCCCCGAAAATITLFDVSNAFVPVYLSATFLAGAYDVSIANIGNQIYCFVPSSGSFILYIYNITNPLLPTLKGSINLTPQATGSLYSCVYSAGYVYISTQQKGLCVVDVGGGAGGGTLTVPVMTYLEGGTTNKSFGVAVSNGYVYTTNYQTGAPYTIRQFKTWAITGFGTPSVPVLVGNIQLITAAEALGFSIGQQGTTAFVTMIGAGGIYSINVVDITNPLAATNISQIAPSFSFNSGMIAKSAANKLYIPSGTNVPKGGAIDCYDITTRAMPKKIATITNNISGCVFGGISLLGPYIYVGDYASSGTLASCDIYTQYF